MIWYYDVVTVEESFATQCDYTVYVTTVCYVITLWAAERG